MQSKKVQYRSEFLKKIKRHVRRNFGEKLYLRVLNAEKNKIKNQNKIQIPFIIKFAKLKKKLKLLDIGCGTGGATVAWSLKGLDCTGIDLIKEDLNIAKLRAKAQEINPRFIKVSGTHLPFKQDTFDIIICDQVLEHTPNFKKTIKEIKRVAKKNAIIYIDMPNKFFPVEPHYKLFFIHWIPKKLQRIYLKLRKRKKLYYPIKLRTYFELKKEINKQNFEILATTQNYIKEILDYSCFKNIAAKILNKLGVPFFIFSPTIQFILKKK